MKRPNKAPEPTPRSITSRVVPILVAAAAALSSTEAKAIDISGEYSEYGMTLRADAGAPQYEVLLGSLLSLELDPSMHKKWYEGSRRMRIRQYEDIAIEFYGFGGTTLQGGRTGFFHGNWAKADGLQVSEDALVLPRRPNPPPKDLWRAVLSFTLDEEKRLIVTAKFTSTKKPVRTLTGVYAFPRFSK